MYLQVSVQAEDFDLGAELQQLKAATPQAGALVNFVGLVRELAADGQLSEMVIEHYPGMTEKALHQIAQTASQRWPLLGVRMIHRVGTLSGQAQIVLVATTSLHRQAAFEACAFMMDYLKTEAPFWKKEIGDFGQHWVEARASDEQAKQQWKLPK
ncbi:molybdenum cofactor biosynthesis protein MoaE [Methylophilus medardicus]|uniref:Molybdopterin synthase catalytic subunit n=1 Tax=Methylophilus medardicus TaxID=2588534 RepID=A0A5B8CS39_9PROT|nr:molybdenum cofactor biosynthesis protein MoaE [Methylophilus medardicus]QDC43886.1 molybdenum cofactor biosynthesis protein MoaE [Methylophilus medardicus]QDC48893.1 molybdenum cofactor biosynthesis protein MoaE [Methylophilus medardicus]QDC52598.1 molybdenum cofactor biosynthesis protein MoaE [Methylophilus medardicus]